MKTGEAKLKDQVKALLAEHRLATVAKPLPDALGYYNMPVPFGYGEPMLDFIGHYRGFFFSIETKDVGKKPTSRQDLTIAAMRAGDGVAIWADNIDVIRTKFEFFTQRVDFYCTLFIPTHP